MWYPGLRLFPKSSLRPGHRIRINFPYFPVLILSLCFDLDFPFFNRHKNSSRIFLQACTACFYQYMRGDAGFMTKPCTSAPAHFSGRSATCKTCTFKSRSPSFISRISPSFTSYDAFAGLPFAKILPARRLHWQWFCA